MYARLGFSVADAAKFLQVTPRTVQEWISGRVRIPFAAYKLLRVQLHYELPGAAWDGWALSAGRLYTPEGHELRPQDFTWWSLLVRRAALFSVLYARHEGALARPDRARGMRSVTEAGRDASRAEGAERRGGGLVSSKTKAKLVAAHQAETSGKSTACSDITAVAGYPPVRYQNDHKVISPCEPTHFDSRTNSPTLHALTPTPWASVSMRWSPSPLTPTCTVNLGQSRARSATHPKQNLKPHRNPPPGLSSLDLAPIASTSGTAIHATGATSTTLNSGHGLTPTGPRQLASESLTPASVRATIPTTLRPSRSRPSRTRIGLSTSAPSALGSKSPTSPTDCDALLLGRQDGGCPCRRSDGAGEAQPPGVKGAQLQCRGMPIGQGRRPVSQPLPHFNTRKGGDPI